MENQINVNTKEFSIKQIIKPLIAILMAMLLVMLDSTIMNVAIPQLENIFKTDLKTIQWAISGYTLALSAVIPLAGWFSDRFTSKKVVLVSEIIFIISSILCTIAKTPAQLIVFRVLQGLGGGMIAPISMALSFKIAPPDKRGSIMGILGLPMLIAPILGPVISGFLLQYASWHWIFLINIPIGIIAIILGIKFLPSSSSGKNFKLDIFGAFLAPISFAALIYGVRNGSGEGWSNTATIVSLIIGFVFLALLIIAELRQNSPLLELRSFGSIEFTKGMILHCMNWTAIFGTALMLPIYFQQLRGFSTLHSGLMIIPQAVMSFLGMIAGGKIFDKRGAKPVIFTGLLLLSLALFCLSGIKADTSIYLLIVVLAILGLGQGLTSMQINTYVLKSAPERLISRVTPMTAASQQIFGSFAVALISGLLTSNISKQIAIIDPNVPEAQVKAMAVAFDHTFIAAMMFAICGMLLSLLLQSKKAKDEPKINK
ncbi:MDR family MFS transporter [Clostridium aminobutyricum]|uniref:Multidrug efflux MFS transporter n=1 Tax=Clostridium aminobutyricum TaxID=33953 RepID=A0A939D9E8_CLOAM|nr:MDR family MFS transporter [Clostridium aminobutyricum]MBN7773525.1 multidrug efflux MFS transporter [Clostridium aminobutyricum]